MRRVVALSFTVLLSAIPARAQEWTEYKNVQDGFRVLFPGQPKIAEIKWTSEMGYTLPARVYTAERGKERYSVTVVDYGPIEQQGIARRKACPPGAETCIGSDLSGPGHWKHDVRGALIFTTAKFLQRDSKLTHYLWNHQDLVEGHELQLTNNADQSRTFVFIGMHEMKLYILEGTVPKGAPEPALFQSSAGWLDPNGNGIRYQTIYANQFYGLKQMPPPARAGGGRGRGGAEGQGGGGRRGGGPAGQ
jgi:hypothetical protein